MAHDMEPLDARLWFKWIEKIARRELALENALRHASHLLQLAPVALRPVMQLATDEDRFEALLEDGEFDVAACHLVAQPTALLPESNPDGTQVLAAISCPIMKEVISGTGQTEAASILDAWTACLLAIKSMFGEDLAAQIETNTQKAIGRFPATDERRRPSFG